MDGSHIDVTATCPCAATSSTWGGCVITYGANRTCQLFSEPALAVADADLYLRKPDDPSNEVLIAGSLLGALRTVREVERLADAVENCPTTNRHWPCWTAPLDFWDLQRGNCPRYVAERLVGQRFQTALARLRAASTDRRPVAVAAYTSRPSHHRGCRRRAPHALRPVRRRLLTASAPPAARNSRPVAGRRVSMTGRCSSCYWTGTPLAPVSIQPPSRPLRPGPHLGRAVEPLLLPQRRRRDRLRRGPRLAGRGL